MSETKPKVLRDTEYVTTYFEISSVTLWRWRKDGAIGYYMIAGKPKFSDEQIQEALDRMKRKAAA